MLILADGVQIDLVHDLPEVVEQKRAIIRGENGKLLYEVKRDSLLNDETVEETFNRVVTYVGGDYFLTLSDGTRVWLNADSELEFPVSFVRNERVVKLQGEAYFEVQRDVNKPFIVDANGLRTRVLGTWLREVSRWKCWIMEMYPLRELCLNRECKPCGMREVRPFRYSR